MHTATTRTASSLRRLTQTAALALLAGTPALAQPLTTIALTGQPAPGVGPDITFARFSPPALAPDGTGSLVFFATLAGDGLSADLDEALFRLRNGTLELVVRESDPAPWYAPDTRFVGLSDFAIDGLGSVTLAASVDDPAVMDNATKARALGIFAEVSNNTFAPLGRIDDQAEGLPDGDLYDTLNSPTVAAVGSAFFTGGRPGDGLDSLPKGLWTDRTGSVTLLLTPGDIAPGTQGQLFAHFAPPTPAPAGGYVFRGSSRPDGSTDRATPGLWRERNNTFDALALGGQPAPGTASTFAEFAAQQAINADARVAFVGTLDVADPESDSGLWTDRGGSLVLLVREGDAAPGTDSSTIAAISPHVVLNDAGDIAFRCGLRNADSQTNTAIYLARADGSFQLVALEGDGIADELGDVTIATLGDPQLNNAGEMLFAATLTGADVDRDSNHALLARDTDGIVYSVAREGQMIDPDGSGMRQIRSIVADTSAARAGRDPLDETGRVGLALSFTDNTFGVFTAAVAYVSPADINADGIVDTRDFVAFLNLWNAQDPEADFNNDGIIDSRDFVLFLNIWSRDRS
ncbi:MAG: GC-type dockerin domain-anchored protein [Planctomycetota bacterium]|nr:GC-type dockerin domain-anchored protein [Planctomycetota bacterium]